MSEITAASQEQSSGIEEVNRAITQMDEMTQQNAALVEQAAAAAASMQTQAAALTEAVAVFKLKESAAGDRRSQLRLEPKQAHSLPMRPKAKVVSSTRTSPPAVPKPHAPAGTGDDWEEF